MSVIDKGKSPDTLPHVGKNKRRFLSAEKKYQIFLESQRGEAPVGELLRREGLYSTDLARIQRKVKESALQGLAKRPGRSKKTGFRRRVRCAEEGASGKRARDGRDGC